MLEKLRCLRCNHTWIPRVEGRPVQCPSCKSRLWDQQRAGNGNVAQKEEETEMATQEQREQIIESSVEYGLVNHVPGGEVYVMRWQDSAVSGPISFREHLAALANAASLGYDPDDAEWARSQSWQPHNELGNCPGCNA